MLTIYKSDSKFGEISTRIHWINVGQKGYLLLQAMIM
jgi:hypothetical protein